MLEGKLVRLRPLEPGDLERAYAWMNDPEVTYSLGRRYPISHAEEERWLGEAASANNFASGVRLAIETKEG
jgi:RimJ/RimL family protein N-acetyltransferase